MRYVIRLKLLREVKVNVGHTKQSAYYYLSEHLRQQGVEIEDIPTQPHSKNLGATAEGQEILQTLADKRGTIEESIEQQRQALGPEDKEKFKVLYDQVTQLVSQAKFVVVSKLISLVPSAFDLKDGDGNLLMSVENAKYDDSDFTSSDGDYSNIEDYMSDPDEQTPSNKKR